MLPKAPCLNCPDREVLCHSKCEKYISFRYELDKYNQEQLKEKIINQEIERVKSYTIKRRKSK